MPRIRRRCAASLFAHLVFVSAGISCWAAAPDVNALPKPTGYVSDLAHVVNEADKERLETYCTRVDQQLGVQFALVTIDSIGDTPIDRFSIDLARAWGVGDKKTNQGILVLLAVKDRKSRVEIGRGAEPYLTDGFAGRTLRSMRPDLQGGNYGAAFLEGARTMAAEVAQGKGMVFDQGDLPLPNAPPDRTVTVRRQGFPLAQIVVGICVLLFILRLFGRGGRGGGGFWTGFLLSSLLNSGGRGSGWGGGGGGFGGDSGGGGGFGGFGGGDFGGGGASSDW